MNWKKNSDNPDDLPSMDLDSGELQTPKKPQTRKYPNARGVFALWGKYPKNWEINKTQLQAAENLFSERGAPQIIKALNLIKEYKDHRYFPSIQTPYDMDSKWGKLVRFKNKHT